jgi:3-isopropylmalate/(R)-2-methylmalate dehydratase small subunit
MRDMSIHKGKVYKLGDDIDTDIIIPTQYMALKNIEAMKKYAFEPLRAELPALLEAGDILVCGKNFGCGSSREQAPEILKALGVYCVIAGSFARIFYRNSMNNGLLLIENEEIYNKVSEGELLAVDLGENILQTASGDRCGFNPIPEMLLKMIQCGGLVNYYKKINKE